MDELHFELYFEGALLCLLLETDGWVPRWSLRGWALISKRCLLRLDYEDRDGVFISQARGSLYSCSMKE
jgi:hypothetical protein